MQSKAKQSKAKQIKKRCEAKRSKAEDCLPIHSGPSALYSLKSSLFQARTPVPYSLFQARRMAMYSINIATGMVVANNDAQPDAFAKL